MPIYIIYMFIYALMFEQGKVCLCSLWIIILDIYIYIQDNYPSYYEGMHAGIVMRGNAENIHNDNVHINNVHDLEMLIIIVSNIKFQQGQENIYLY